MSTKKIRFSINYISYIFCLSIVIFSVGCTNSQDSNPILNYSTPSNLESIYKSDQEWNDDTFWHPISEKIKLNEDCNSLLSDVAVNCNGILFSYPQYFCSNNFLLIKSKDGGKNWEDLSKNIKNAIQEESRVRMYVRNIFIEQNKIYIIVEKEYFTLGKTEKYLLISMNEGKSWDKILNSPKGCTLSIKNDSIFASYHRTNNTYSYIGFLRQNWDSKNKKWVDHEQLVHDTNPASPSLVYSKFDPSKSQLVEKYRFFYENMKGARFISYNKGVNYSEAFRDRITKKKQGSLFSDSTYDKISRDQGKTWEPNWLNINVLSQCKDLWIAQGANNVNETGREFNLKGNCISQDKGKTWNRIAVTFPSKNNFKSHIGPNGYMYYLIDNRVVRSSFLTTCGCNGL